MSKKVADPSTLISNVQSLNLDVMERIRPTLVGPLAKLYRFNELSERTVLGAYDPDNSEEYSYPTAAVGLLPDVDFTKVYVKNGYVRFFNKPIGVSGTAIPPASPTNRVRAANFIFKTANGFNRSATFGDRDVKVGDVVKLSAVISTVLVEHTSTVTGFVGEPVAAVVGSATAASTNASTQSAAGPTATQVAGTPLNYVEATGGGTYDSLDDGAINRTYTVTVTQSSVGGDPTTALLRVRSSDGLDDQDNVSPAAYAAATSIGTKGATITFNTDNMRPVDSGVSDDDMVAGQQWTLVCQQAYTAPTATAAGTYTGTKNLTYIVTVDFGAGIASGNALISAVSSDGTDYSGPTAVPNLATAVAVGSFGATIAFSGAGSSLRPGDAWQFTATAASEAQIRTLVLRDNVPSDLLTEDCNLEIMTTVDDFEIPKIRTTPSLAYNWQVDEDTITIEDGIYVHPDSSFTNSGVETYFPLISGDIYLHHRYWDTTREDAISVYSLSDAQTELGSLSKDNPLGFAASFALSNTASALLANPSVNAEIFTDRVLVAPLAGSPDDMDSWESAIDYLLENDLAYNIVPLTSNKAVHDLYAQKVKDSATDRDGSRKRCVLPITLPDEVIKLPVDDTVISMTVTSGDNGNNLVTGPVNVGFIDYEIRAGDVLRINYSVDALNQTSYDTYTVREVLTNNTLYLTSGPAVPISLAIKAEVWRPMKGADKVTYAENLAASYDSSRVLICVADKFTDGTDELEDYTVASAVAGLMGSVASQQGLKGSGVAGFALYTKAKNTFLTSHLKQLESKGVFLVFKDVNGDLFIRSASSTDFASVEAKEEMITRNADAVWFEIQKAWADLRGVGNLVDAVQDMLQSRLDQLAAKLKGGNATRGLGPPAVALRIDSVAQIPGQPDALDINVEMVGPYPLNTTYLNLQLV